mmetsp:Transcript_94937/g.277591  ORF Transcript_94937/g.277591 Transcript_94937/m.277591 type:complete len:258 (+) Transcript_94937:731-1504(+)
MVPAWRLRDCGPMCSEDGEGKHPGHEKHEAPHEGVGVGQDLVRRRQDSVQAEQPGGADPKCGSHGPAGEHLEVLVPAPVGHSLAVHGPAEPDLQRHQRSDERDGHPQRQLGADPEAYALGPRRVGRRRLGDRQCAGSGAALTRGELADHREWPGRRGVADAVDQELHDDGQDHLLGVKGHRLVQAVTGRGVLQGCRGSAGTKSHAEVVEQHPQHEQEAINASNDVQSDLRGRKDEPLWSQPQVCFHTPEPPDVGVQE